MLLKIDKRLNDFKYIEGTYVNAGTIVSTMKIPVLDMTDEELDMYAKLIKKAVSGKEGKSLLEVDLKNPEGLKDFATGIIDNLDTDKNYCIISAEGMYETEEEQTPYYIYAVCPIKETKTELKYTPQSKEFRGASSGNILKTPMIGILYPSFLNDVEQGKAMYTFAKDKHEELLESLGSAPESSDEIKQKIHAAMSEAFQEDFLPAAAAATSNLATENFITTDSLCDALSEFPEDKVESFRESLGNLSRENVLDDKITILAEGAKLVTRPDKVRTELVNGEKCIIIPIKDVININEIDI